LIHSELRRKSVTLSLLWDEYKGQHPDGYQYSHFCDLYRRWAGTLAIWMRHEHRAGEKLFVDYAGDGISWMNTITGKCTRLALRGRTGCAFRRSRTAIPEEIGQRSG